MELPSYTDEQLTVTIVGTDLTITDPTGKTYVMHHFGAGKGHLQVDPRIDLTKPIFEQAQRLRFVDLANEEAVITNEVADQLAR